MSRKEGLPLVISELNLSDADIKRAFHDKLDKSAGADGCWVYALKHDHGYGSFKIPRTRRSVRAHRFAMALVHGSVPGKVVVMHKCDNPPCCNPSHLLITTQDENMRDAIEKGRIGPKSLSRAQIDEISALLSTTNLTFREIGKRYSCSISAISKIRRGGYTLTKKITRPLRRKANQI